MGGLVGGMATLVVKHTAVARLVGEGTASPVAGGKETPAVVGLVVVHTQIRPEVTEIV